MQSPISPRLFRDSQAGTDALMGSELRNILTDAGLRLGLSVDAVIDRIETEARIRR